jgi:hypothetical protein
MRHTVLHNLDTELNRDIIVRTVLGNDRNTWISQLRGLHQQRESYLASMAFGDALLLLGADPAAEGAGDRERDLDGLLDTYREPADVGDCGRDPDLDLERETYRELPLTLPLEPLDLPSERGRDCVVDRELERERERLRASSSLPSMASNKRLFRGPMSPFSSRIDRF